MSQTPTTGIVRQLYTIAWDQVTDPVDIPLVQQNAREEFDRWLAEELRKAQEQAWGEGFDAGEQDVHQHKTFNEPCIPNPYRSQP